MIHRPDKKIGRLLSRIAATIGLVLAALCMTSIASAQDLSTPSSATAGVDATKGHYLATAGNCLTCHTAKGGKPFAGGVAFPTDFGTIYSPNITQDMETGIGKWTLEDFKKAMRQGVRPDGTQLYPAFPYTDFTKLTDDDVAALYAYMRTLTPEVAPAKASTLRFPYSVRALMIVWKALYFKDARFVPDPSKTPEINRGAYLVEGLGHCGACHTPRNSLGAEARDAPFTGGVLNDAIPGGAVRQWSATNLTPHATGLGGWSADDIAAYLKTGLSARATVFGPMDDVVMNSTRKLTDEDTKAVAAYLKALPAKGPDSVNAASAEMMTQGEIVYTIRCGTCHLPTGLGSDILGVPIVGSAVTQAPNPASLVNVILYGPQLPPAPDLISPHKPMAPLADEMSDDEIAAVSTYIRASWGNRAAPVSAEMVAKQR